MNSLLMTNGKDISSNLFHSIANDPLSTQNDKRPGEMPRGRSLLIIDDRALDRQCLAYCISAHKIDMDVLAFGSVEEWERKRHDYPQLAAVLLNIGGKKIGEPSVSEEITRLAAAFEAPIIVLADADDLPQIMKALECGAKGYIPSSVSIDVCIEAIALSMAGGIFVPASSVFAMRQALETGSPAARPTSPACSRNGRPKWSKHYGVARPTRSSPMNSICAKAPSKCISAIS